MLDNPVLQNILSVTLYLVRILVPLLSIYVVCRCFLSLKAGRRREEPVVILQDMVTKEIIPVLYWENSLGRSRSCDIVLPDGTASRDHAVLMRRESGWIVVDTESKAGTRVNGKKIDHSAQILPGDVISMGSTSLMLKRTSEVKNLKQPKRRQRHAASPLGLLFTTMVIQALLCIEVCFTGEAFDYMPLIPLGALVVMEWGLYLYSMKGLNRVSFELETVAFLLSGIGIMLIAGTGVEKTYMQLGAMLLGIVLFCAMIWFLNDLDRVMKCRLAIAVLALILFAVNLVLAEVSHGARNWISIGPVSIQPSEFIKIAFVFVGASTLDRLQTARNLGGFILFGGACLGALFLMRDFGTACIFFVTFLIIAFMRSGSVRTIVLICSAAVFGVFLILKFKPYIAQRFAAWRHVWEYANETGFQQTRVLTYTASGGFFGVGLGNGYLKNVFAANSDLVFGMLSEELGLLLALVVVISIALLVFYARSDVTRSRSTFYSISACAAAGMMLFQTCLNVFGATDVLPLTGVTLPFVSLGGSSMMACWGLLAFIKASDERTYAARRQKSAR